MAKIAAPLTITAVLVLLGCGSTTAELPVRTEYSKTTSFHEWKTFRFSSEPTGGSDVTRYPRYEKMVQQALLDELTDRGYTRIEDGTPDFRVAFDLRFRGDTTPKMTPEGGGADPTARSYGAILRRTDSERHFDRQDARSADLADPVVGRHHGDQNEGHRAAERAQKGCVAGAGGIPADYGMKVPTLWRQPRRR
jgi:hypothetical protein